jgi:hypothetical protein
MTFNNTMDRLGKSPSFFFYSLGEPLAVGKFTTRHLVAPLSSD